MGCTTAGCCPTFYQTLVRSPSPCCCLLLTGHTCRGRQLDSELKQFRLAGDALMQAGKRDRQLATWVWHGMSGVLLSRRCLPERIAGGGCSRVLGHASPLLGLTRGPASPPPPSFLPFSLPCTCRRRAGAGHCARAAPLPPPRLHRQPGQEPGSCGSLCHPGAHLPRLCQAEQHGRHHCQGWVGALPGIGALGEGEGGGGEDLPGWAAEHPAPAVHAFSPHPTPCAGESVANLADVLGTAFGIVLARASPPLVPSFCLLSVGFLVSSRLEVDSVVLPYLNRARLSYAACQFCHTGGCRKGACQGPQGWVWQAGPGGPCLPWRGPRVLVAPSYQPCAAGVVSAPGSWLLAAAEQPASPGRRSGSSPASPCPAALLGRYCPCCCRCHRWRACLYAWHVAPSCLTPCRCPQATSPIQMRPTAASRCCPGTTPTGRGWCWGPQSVRPAPRLRSWQRPWGSGAAGGMH